MDMHNEPVQPMTAETVADFDVWIFDSHDLSISVVPLHAPWSATAESYELSQSAQ